MKKLNKMTLDNLRVVTNAEVGISLKNSLWIELLRNLRGDVENEIWALHQNFFLNKNVIKWKK